MILTSQTFTLLKTLIVFQLVVLVELKPELVIVIITITVRQLSSHPLYLIENMAAEI